MCFEIEGLIEPRAFSIDSSLVCFIGHTHFFPDTGAGLLVPEVGVLALEFADDRHVPARRRHRGRAKISNRPDRVSLE